MAVDAEYCRNRLPLPSRSSACRALLAFARTRSLKRIDAGLGQINLGWNGQWFPSLCASFDPEGNLTVTALLLRQHYNASPEAG